MNDKDKIYNKTDPAPPIGPLAEQSVEQEETIIFQKNNEKKLPRKITGF